MISVIDTIYLFLVLVTVTTGMGLFAIMIVGLLLKSLFSKRGEE